MLLDFKAQMNEDSEQLGQAVPKQTYTALSTQFPVQKDGKPVKDHPENLRFLIQNIMGFSCATNELTQGTEINNKKIEDVTFALICNECRRQGLSSSKDFVDQVIAELAHHNRYHPFKDMIESVPWDGTNHIGELFKTLKLDPEYNGSAMLYESYLRKWLIGIIAKVYKPGSQNMMLVLKGGQGIGKSRWASSFGIVPDSYGEGVIDPDNKDHELRHLTKLIWHVAELDGVTRKKDVAALKDYLTKESVSVRRAYGRFETNGRSILSFIGSVNSDQFLSDVTGNRRFLIIPLEDIDTVTKINMQQVYAQAFSLYQAGNQWWFDKAEIELVNKENEDSTIQSALDDLVTEVRAGKVERTIYQVLVELGYKKSAAEISHGEATKFGNLLHKAGIRKIRKVVNGQKITMWLVYSNFEQ